VLRDERDEQKDARRECRDLRSPGDDGRDTSSRERCESADREACELRGQSEPHRLRDARILWPRAAHDQARENDDERPRRQSADDAENFPQNGLILRS
jgi:hypothetical protein